MTVWVGKSCPEDHLCNRKRVIRGKLSNKKTAFVYVLRPIFAVCVPWIDRMWPTGKELNLDLTLTRSNNNIFTQKLKLPGWVELLQITPE